MKLTTDAMNLRLRMVEVGGSTEEAPAIRICVLCGLPILPDMPRRTLFYDVHGISPKDALHLRGRSGSCHAPCAQRMEALIREGGHIPTIWCKHCGSPKQLLKHDEKLVNIVTETIEAWPGAMETLRRLSPLALLKSAHGEPIRLEG